MNKKVFHVTLFSVLSTLLLVESACGPMPLAPTHPAVPMTPVAGITDIGTLLKKALTGRIAYNAPAEMQLEQSQDIQLLLSPIASEAELKQKIEEIGQIVAAEIEITPLMKAELKSDDPQAFTIQAFHDAPEQVVLSNGPTEWRWSLTAKKSGDQTVTLSLYRQVDYNGKPYWSMIETYKNSIHITVTPGQWFQNFDWKWLIGILLTAILIPAMWRIIDRNSKKKQRAGKARAR